MKLTFGSPECEGGAQRENVWNQNHPTNTLSSPFKAEVSKTEFQASGGMSLWCLTIRPHTPPTLFMLLDIKNNVSGNHPWLFSYRTSVSYFMHHRDHKPGYKLKSCQWIFSFVQFSRSVMSDSATPWSQHSRLPCPSPAFGAYSNSCPWSWWCHPTISSSVIPFSLRLQSFLASQSFPVVSSLHQVAKVLELHSAWASVHPVNIQGWFPLGLTGLISLQSKGLSRVFSSTTIWKYRFFSAQPSVWSNSHICTWLLENDYMDLCEQSDVSAF